MVLDSSALVAVLFGEPEGPRFVRLIAEASDRLVSVVTTVECAMVVEGRRGEVAGVGLDQLLRRYGVTIMPVDPEQAAIARSAWRRFGKGRHPAALNLGDTFSYALAKSTGLPLLCKGDDFAQTDIVLAA